MIILFVLVLLAIFLVPAIWFGLRDGVEGFLVGGFFGFMAAAVVGLSVLSYVHANYDERVLSCTITDKDRGGDDGSYRVYTEECGQLSNNNSLWRGKYDSADVWQDIQPGETVDLRIVGWRSEFFSVFPNILEVESR